MGTLRMNVLTACRLSRFGQAGFLMKNNSLVMAMSGFPIHYITIGNKVARRISSNNEIIQASGKWKPIAPKVLLDP